MTDIHYKSEKNKYWAGKTADMTFGRVECHSGSGYTEEKPYTAYTVVNKGFYGGDKHFGLEFYAISCEYDNFKDVVIKTDDKTYTVEFHENGQIYFCGEETFICYDIDKWYKFELLFGDGVILKINGADAAKTDGKIKEIEEVGIKTTAYPTYGPILASSIGICDINYKFETFDFNAVNIFGNDYFYTAKKHSIDEVAANIDVNTLAAADNGGTRIKHSLNFSPCTFSDILIEFTSDDENIITKSGRLIRPKYEDKMVGVTAKISDGEREIIKKFDFIAAAEEKFSDPNYMSDEEFFGKYNGDEAEIVGKLDYKNLPLVEKYVKQGNYKLAKEELAKHFKNKYYEKSNLKYNEFDCGYAEMILNDFHQLQQGYFLGAFNSGEHTVKINHTLIKLNSTMTFSVRAMYNESSAFALNGNPVLAVKTDKRTVSCTASETAEVRAGNNRHRHVADTVKKAEMFGEFLGNRTSYILIKFPIYGFLQNEKIISAELNIGGETIPAYTGEKRLIVIKEFSSTWNGEDIKFSDLIYGVYSYQGLTDKNKWGRPPYADVEYLWQTSRFPFYSSILAAYEHTGNEELLYRLKKNIEEAIVTFGGFKSSGGRYTYDENGIRGGYTRTLDASGKYTQWILIFTYLVKSPYADSEFITAFLKAIWDTLNYLLTNCDRHMGNWTEFIFRGILMSSDTIDEFKPEFNGENRLEACRDVYEKTICGCFFPDGSYKEGNSGYCQTALDNYIAVKEKLKTLGIEVSENYNAMVRKNAHYCANLFTADGSSLVYGDCINYRREEYNDWGKICNVTGDEELRYLVTYGKEGVKPKSTTYHSADSRLTVMRSDFGKDAVYLFTDVRGGGGHSHCDENSIIMAAYGKTLLCDSGVFSYTSDDPYRIWGLSTRAHNTVEADEKNQAKFSMDSLDIAPGKIHKIYDDDKISYVVQSSYAYDFCEHKRSIVFVKPDIFIVRDELIPNDGRKHTYDILWHFLPQSNAICTGNVCETRFENSANLKMLIIGDTQNEILGGYVDLSYGQIEKSEYLRSRINSADGAEVITVLIPQKKGKKRNIEAYCENGGLIIKENGTLIFSGGGKK